MQTYILLGLVALLIIVVVELIQSRKSLKACLEIKESQMKHLFSELNALENHTNSLIAQYEQECV